MRDILALERGWFRLKNQQSHGQCFTVAASGSDIAPLKRQMRALPPEGFSGALPSIQLLLDA